MVSGWGEGAGHHPVCRCRCRRARMEFLLELLFEIFGEFILQFVFEAISQAFLHLFKRPGRPEPGGAVSAWWAVAGYALLGMACGALSVWLFPHFLLHSHGARLLNLALTPVLAAGAVAWVGQRRSRSGLGMVRLDRFTYAYVFAFAMGAVRFALAGAVVMAA